MRLPPIGLKPRFITDEERLEEIRLAIIRYLNANCTIRIEWVEEYNEIVERMEKRGH